MKLYKIDFKNMVGQNCVTVPTDSQFLIGLSNGDADSTAKLYNGETEITAEEEKVGSYTVFRFETGTEPSINEYKGVFTGTDYAQAVDIRVKTVKQSVAYRDLEGNPTYPITKEDATGDEHYLTVENFQLWERGIYVVGQAASTDTVKTLSVDVELDSFGAFAEDALFKTNLIVQCGSGAVAVANTLLTINLVSDDETVKTLTPSDFGIDGQVGITTLDTVIGDNTGTALLVELNFGLTDAFACVKGHSYLPTPVEP